MKKIVLGLALLGALAGRSAWTAAPDETDMLQAVSNAYRSQEGIGQLLSRISGFEARFPKSDYLAQLRMLAGEVQFAAGAFDQALQTYTRLIKDQPNTPYAESAAYRMGECWFNAGDYQAARRQWQSMLPAASRPFRPEVLFGLAECQVQLGEWEKAGKSFGELLEAYPSYRERSNVRNAMGKLAFNRREYDRAAEWLEGIESAEAWYYSGRAFFQMNKLNEAAGCFDRIMEKYPTEEKFAATAVFEKAETLYAMRLFGQAEAVYRYFLSGYSNHALVPFAQYKISCIEMLDGRQESAWQRLLKLDLGETGNRLVAYLRAGCLIRMNRPKEAFAIFDGLWHVVKEPELSADLLLKKAWLHLELGDYKSGQEELEVYTRTFSVSPFLPHASFLLGNSLFLQKKYRQANQVYHDTILNFPYSKITDACLLQIQKSCQAQQAPDKLIADTGYILRVLEVNFPPENKTLRAFCYFMMGEAYYQVRQYASAAKCNSYILENFPGTPVGDLARESLAWDYFQDAKYGEAEKIAKELLGKPGLDAEMLKRARLLRMHCLFNLKQYSRALANYKFWIQTYPKDEQIPEALFGLSQSYLRIGNGEKSLGIMMQIVTRHQKNPLAKKALLMIGHAYFNEGSYEKALRVYLLFLKSWPDDPQIQEVRLRVAQTLYNAGKIRQAREEYRRYIQEYPGGSYTNEALAGVELVDWRETDTLRTKVRYQDFLKQHPKSEFADLAQYRLGVLFYEEKAYTDCIREFRALNYNYPASQYLPRAQYYLGMCFEKQGQTLEALQIYEQFIRNFANHDLMPEVLSRLAEVQFRDGRYLQAAQNYRLILEKYPLPEYSADALYNLGVCYEREKMWTDAIQTYLLYSEKYPSGARAQDVSLHVGIAYHQMQKYREACGYLEKFLVKGKAAALPELLYRLGDAHDHLGETEQALGFYRRARSLNPPGNEYRLLALSQLGALLEKRREIENAIAIYRDIRENSQNAAWRQLASKRIHDLESR